MAIFWALICLALAAVNDLVFKFYARKPRSNGYFAAIVGVVWLPMAWLFTRGLPADWTATLVWGAISGIFSIGGNLLMLEAMRTLDAGVCATIYRLNLVPVVIGAALLLGESLTAYQYGGIVCACTAVLAFIPAGGGRRRLLAAGFAMMLAASLMRAGLGLSYRYGFLHGADQAWVVVIDSLFWIAGGVVYARLRERREAGGAEWRKLWGYGVLSGVLVTGIVLTMAESLALGRASVVLPVAQMSFLGTGLLGVWLLKEKITWRKSGAFACGVAAILLLSL